MTLIVASFIQIGLLFIFITTACTILDVILAKLVKHKVTTWRKSLKECARYAAFIAPTYVVGLLILDTRYAGLLLVTLLIAAYWYIQDAKEHRATKAALAEQKEVTAIYREAIHAINETFADTYNAPRTGSTVYDQNIHN